MNRNFVCLSRTLIAVFALAISSQAANAQLYGGGCCGSVYSSAYATPAYGYGYGAPVSAYYGYPSTIGYGYGFTPSYGGCGIGSGCGTGCGLFGHFRRRCAPVYCASTCNYPSYYQPAYYGCATTACYVRPRRIHGCRPRGYTYACGTVACALPSPIYTGAIATCCAPVATTCADASFSSYPIETGYSTAAPVTVSPAPTLSPTTSPAPTPATEKDPAPPKEPVAPAPEPGT